MSPFHLSSLAKFIDYWRSCISEQVFSIHQVSQPDRRTAGRATEIVELASFQSKEQSSLRQLVPCIVYICKIQQIKNSQPVKDWLRIKQQRAPFILGTEYTMISNCICIMIQKVLAQGLPSYFSPWSHQPHTFELLNLPRHQQECTKTTKLISHVPQSRPEKNQTTLPRAALIPKTQLWKLSGDQLTLMFSDIEVFQSSNSSHLEKLNKISI